MSDAIFEELQKTADAQGPEAAMVKLTDKFKAEGRIHELFDARLLESRLKLGLPAILTSSLDDLPEPHRTQIENAYLAACREAGEMLLAAGRIREAWMYLRPVGDKTLVAAALEKAEVNDENVEEMIDLALHQGVCPRLGFEWVLANYGTCNAISMFDAEMHERPKQVKQEVAGVLVRHLHRELLENLKAEVKRQEGSLPADETIELLVADRDWLFAEDNYHIDTSHLSSVIRFARLVEDEPSLRLAADLTEYGKRLSRQYQFAGEEPFADVYAASGLFFRAQLGQQVAAALAHFEDRAHALPAAEHGPMPVETYLTLLARLRRFSEAIDAWESLVPPGTRLSGFGPSLGELAKQGGEYARMMQISRKREDLLGFAASLIESAKARR